MSFHRSALLTDLYQLTMLQGYVHADVRDQAVFEFFVRKMPQERNFLVAAGLEQALDYLENLSFTYAELDWLAEIGQFRTELIDYLRGFRFSGEVHAMPEGTVFFEDEPILRVTAPLPEAQLAESRLINLLHFQSLIATKAARSVLVAPDKSLIDFGMRRAHGAEAALLAARASYLVGFTGTATCSEARTSPVSPSICSLPSAPNGSTSGRRSAPARTIAATSSRHGWHSAMCSRTAACSLPVMPPSTQRNRRSSSSAKCDADDDCCDPAACLKTSSITACFGGLLIVLSPDDSALPGLRAESERNSLTLP